MPVLKGNKYFYDYEATSALSYNIRRWLEYGLTEMGAYTIVSFSNPQTSGFTNLKRVVDDKYGGQGKVYEGAGPSWVWENDIVPIQNASGTIQRPLIASGVYINNTFYLTSSTSGIYEHNIDFRTGRVLFKNTLPSGSRVSCEYTFRDIGIYGSETTEWKRIIQAASEKFNNADQNNPSGMFQILKSNRVYPPCIVVQVNTRTNSPLQLGGGEIASFDVDYHIFADKPATNAKLADVISNQYDKTLRLFDVNDIQFPFKGDGTLTGNPLTYKQLEADNSPYFWTFAHISQSEGGWRDSETDVFRAECSHLIDVDRYLITY